MSVIGGCTAQAHFRQSAAGRILRFHQSAAGIFLCILQLAAGIILRFYQPNSGRCHLVFVYQLAAARRCHLPFYRHPLAPFQPLCTVWQPPNSQTPGIWHIRDGLVTFGGRQQRHLWSGFRISSSLICQINSMCLDWHNNVLYLSIYTGIHKLQLGYFRDLARHQNKIYI